jgi:hypothetical protein
VSRGHRDFHVKVLMINLHTSLKRGFKFYLCPFHFFRAELKPRALCMAWQELYHWVTFPVHLSLHCNSLDCFKYCYLEIPKNTKMLLTAVTTSNRPTSNPCTTHWPTQAIQSFPLCSVKTGETTNMLLISNVKTEWQHVSKNSIKQKGLAIINF